MKAKIIAALALCMALLAGCGGGRSSTTQQAVVYGGSGGTAAARQQAEEALAEAELDEATGEHSYDDHQLEAEDDVIEIKEKLFIAQTNEITLNFQDYLGKTIRYEGIYMKTEMEGIDPYHWVVRYGPGCCGNDGTAGFEVLYDGEYPEENDWVEVTGVLHYYDINGWTIPYLKIVSYTVLEERGQEYVNM